MKWFLFLYRNLLSRHLNRNNILRNGDVLFLTIIIPFRNFIKKYKKDIYNDRHLTVVD